VHLIIVHQLILGSGTELSQTQVQKWNSAALSTRLKFCRV